MFSAGYFPDYSGLERGWYSLSGTFAAVFASLVMYIAVKNNNLNKHFVTIIVLEFILMAFYIVALIEYNIADMAHKAGVTPPQTALIDDNIAAITLTFALVQALILTIGAPWRGILDELLDLAKGCLSAVRALCWRLLDAYPSAYGCKGSHQNLKIALQGQRK